MGIADKFRKLVTGRTKEEDDAYKKAYKEARLRQMPIQAKQIAEAERKAAVLKAKQNAGKSPLDFFAPERIEAKKQLAKKPKKKRKKRKEKLITEEILPDLNNLFREDGKDE